MENNREFHRTSCTCVFYLLFVESYKESRIFLYLLCRSAGMKKRNLSETILESLKKTRPCISISVYLKVVFGTFSYVLCIVSVRHRISRAQTFVDDKEKCQNNVKVEITWHIIFTNGLIIYAMSPYPTRRFEFLVNHCVCKTGTGRPITFIANLLQFNSEPDLLILQHICSFTGHVSSTA